MSEDSVCTQSYFGAIRLFVMMSTWGFMCYIITSIWVWVAPANMMGYQFNDQVPSYDKEEKAISDIIQISN